MGNIHKIGQEYYIEFYARGLLYQQKAGQDHKKALELLASIEQKIASGEALTVERDIDLEIFFYEFIKYARTQWHPCAVGRLQSLIDHFKVFLQTSKTAVTKLPHVTPRIIEDYKSCLINALSSRDRFNPKIVILSLLLLREIFEFGIKNGFINDNPTLHIKLPEIKGFTVGEEELSRFCETLINQSEDACRTVFYLMRYCGLRLDEAVNLGWQDLDTHRHVIFVRNREIPLMPHVREWFSGLFCFALAMDRDASSSAKASERFLRSSSIDPLLERSRIISKTIDDKARVAVFASKDICRADYVLDSLRKHCPGAYPWTLSMFRRLFARDLFEKKFSLLAAARIMGVYDPARMMFYASDALFRREDLYST